MGFIVSLLGRDRVLFGFLVADRFSKIPSIFISTE
jgi:hypothetical protein